MNDGNRLTACFFSVCYPVCICAFLIIFIKRFSNNIVFVVLYRYGYGIFNHITFNFLFFVFFSLWMVVFCSLFFSFFRFFLFHCFIISISYNIDFFVVSHKEEERQLFVVAFFVWLIWFSIYALALQILENWYRISLVLYNFCFLML